MTAFLKKWESAGNRPMSFKALRGVNIASRISSSLYIPALRDESVISMAAIAINQGSNGWDRRRTV
jgi:hypothetical protein